MLNDPHLLQFRLHGLINVVYPGHSDFVLRIRAMLFEKCVNIVDHAPLHHHP